MTVKRVSLISVATALLAVAGILAQTTSSAVVLDEQSMQSLRGGAICECGAGNYCDSCGDDGEGGWISCTAVAMFVDRFETHEDKSWGNCEEYNVDCGQVKACSDSGCNTCEPPSGPCVGCSKANADPC